MSRVAFASVLVVLAATACGNGPRDATPLPEPPSMDLSKVAPPPSEVYAASGGTITLIGEPGAAPGGALVRVTALDGLERPHVFTADADGSFEAINVPGVYGGEFRFQLEVSGRRSEPQDAFFLIPAAAGLPYLVASLRHDCLTLNPGFEVTFEAMAVASLVVENGCDGSVTLSNARSRSGAVGSRTSTALPLVLEPDDGASLSLEFQGSSFGSAEDILFFDVSLEGRSIRYPITLFAP